MVDAPESLTLRQTFPKLRYAWFEDARSSIPPERRINFTQRHPQIKGFLERKLEGPPAFSREICPNFRVLWALPIAVEEHALAGRRIPHVSTFYSLETLYTNSWLTRIPDAARAITCFELFATDGIDNGVPSHLSCAFSSDLLPNLTELSIEYKPNPTVFGMSLSERDLAQLFFNLCSAKYLRVLHLRAAPFENTGDLLAELPDACFPSCLEYFSWHVSNVSERHYYRFVPSQEKDSPPNGSKKGRLQRISPLFCTPITKEGIWERAFDTERRTIIYDHTPLDGPVMRLS
ncbi:unnamed protein product [Tilletia controversa]|nr:unnamed protein product [Tilletia controversa]